MAIGQSISYGIANGPFEGLRSRSISGLTVPGWWSPVPKHFGRRVGNNFLMQDNYFGFANLLEGHKSPPGRGWGGFLLLKVEKPSLMLTVFPGIPMAKAWPGDRIGDPLVSF
jgi:hypothetical protein